MRSLLLLSLALFVGCEKAPLKKQPPQPTPSPPISRPEPYIPPKPKVVLDAFLPLKRAATKLGLSRDSNYDLFEKAYLDFVTETSVANLTPESRGLFNRTKDTYTDISEILKVKYVRLPQLATHMKNMERIYQLSHARIWDAMYSNHLIPVLPYPKADTDISRLGIDLTEIVSKYSMKTTKFESWDFVDLRKAGIFRDADKQMDQALKSLEATDESR